MASFGGTVKLTGESEYRKALTKITQNLRETSSALTLVDSQYSKNDNSIATVTAKNEKLNTILEKQKSAYENLKNSFDKIKVKYDEQINSHNKLQAEYDKEKAKLDKLKNTVGENSTAYEKQKAKVGELATQLNKSQQNIDANEVSMSKLRVQMNNAETSINKTKNQIDDLGKETKDTTNEVKKAGEGFTVFKGIVADLGSKAITSAISGLKKLSGAVVNVGKQAIESYAEYEQLVGGVETLFKDSAGIVEDYANKAYKTAGLSANEYMETVTSFSASLLQSLGGDTKKASEYSNRAIIDMSDNANKMGTAMESIQNAYQGFAKQNYTMLDNLKLGYGGTKEEMARLITDASKLTGVQKELNLTVEDGNMSFGNIVNAISVVQKNMGIMGTTSKEASSTIQGSVNAMKSSWKNLLTAIADDNKDLSKSVDEFVDSAVTASKNLVPRIKVAVEGIKKLISSIVTEVFPKLKKEIPELKPLIETFEWFIKNKSLVINAVKLIITAFAINKIMKFTKSISDGAKGLIDWVKSATLATTATNVNTTAQVANTTAQVAGTGATKALTVATNLLNNAWKANPIGLVIAGVTALISVFSIFKGKTDEVTSAHEKQMKALEKQKEKIDENINAWEDLEKTQQNNVDKGLTQLSYYQSLSKELQGIVDQNGKVKEGYEQRASFITTTLSEALGIEIKNVDGVIQNYNKLKDTIDEVMEKKKAQILLDSQETKYSEAITKQGEATKDLITYEDELKKKKGERAKLEEELKQKQEEYKKAQDSWLTSTKLSAKWEVEQVEEKIKAKDKEVASAETNYNKQAELLSKYAYNIGQYEQNMALFHEGKYSEMSNVNWNYVKDYVNTSDAQKKQLEDQIKNEETYLNLLKELKQKSGTDLYDQQIKDAEQRLENHKENLKQYTSATELGLDANKIKWTNGLDEVLSLITGKNISFKEDGKGNVQMYVDGVKEGKPKSKEEMAKLVSETIKEVTKKDKDAKQAGENLINGVNNGIENRNIQSSVFSSIARFGSSLLSKLRTSLQEHSPSKATKEMGQYLLEGLGLGMLKEENSILKQARDFGKSVIASINGGLSDNIKMSAISDIEQSISGINTSTMKSISEARESTDTNMVEDFKTALSQMKIELDDENMGKFVDRTVARTIYS